MVVPRARPTVGRTVLQVLRIGLAAAAILVPLQLAAATFAKTWGVDIVVPLRAAERWLSGGQPYLASAFQAGPGYDVPYLYPPMLLPLFAPLTWLPTTPVIVTGNVLCALAGYAACRRLGVPSLIAPLLLLWPPFLEAIANVNLGLPLFAAFVFAYWPQPSAPHGAGDAGRSRLHRPSPEDRRRRRPSDLGRGLLAAAIPAVKASQVHAWMGMLRLRPTAAMVGFAFFAALAAMTLPLTGVDLWRDWLAQLGRAADPSGRWADWAWPGTPRRS